MDPLFSEKDGRVTLDSDGLKQLLISANQKGTVDTDESVIRKQQ